MVENLVRRSGRPAGLVKMSAAGRDFGSGLTVASVTSSGTAGNAARWAARASTTT
jgi:hypothetical protein